MNESQLAPSSVPLESEATLCNQFHRSTTSLYLLKFSKS